MKDLHITRRQILKGAGAAGVSRSEGMGQTQVVPDVVPPAY